jgi:hypothetical protein
MRENELAPDELTDLALKVASEAQAAGLRPDVPHRDPRLDAIAMSLPSYGQFRSALTTVEFFDAFYGAGEADRLSIGWVFASAAAGAADAAWIDFWARLSDAEWTYAAVANLVGFDTDCQRLPLMDGLEIRTRSFVALSDALGWSSDKLHSTLGADFMDSYPGRFVVIYKEAVPKSAERVATGNTGWEVVAIRRLLQALRLAAPGDVNVGRIFMGRVRPVIPDLGNRAAGSSVGWLPGPVYQLHEQDVAAVKETYELVKRFEQHAAKHPQIATALARFSGAYDRPWGNPMDRLIDDMIGLEALVGSDQELAFKVATRVSGLLAGTDADRVDLFQRLKSFYRTRSQIVHGGDLGVAHHDNLRREPELRDILRRLVAGFLHLSESTKWRPTHRFVEEQMDEVLLDAQRRSALRDAMMLQPAAPAAPTETSPSGVAMWAEAQTTE